MPGTRTRAARVGSRPPRHEIHRGRPAHVARALKARRPAILGHEDGQLRHAPGDRGQGECPGVVRALDPEGARDERRRRAIGETHRAALRPLVAPHEAPRERADGGVSLHVEGHVARSAAPELESGRASAQDHRRTRLAHQQDRRSRRTDEAPEGRSERRLVSRQPDIDGGVHGGGEGSTPGDDRIPLLVAGAEDAEPHLGVSLHDPDRADRDGALSPRRAQGERVGPGRHVARDRHPHAIDDRAVPVGTHIDHSQPIAMLHRPVDRHAGANELDAPRPQHALLLDPRGRRQRQGSLEPSHQVLSDGDHGGQPDPRVDEGLRSRRRGAETTVREQREPVVGPRGARGGRRGQDEREDQWGGGSQHSAHNTRLTTRRRPRGRRSRACIPRPRSRGSERPP